MSGKPVPSLVQVVVAGAIEAYASKIRTLRDVAAAAQDDAAVEALELALRQAPTVHEVLQHARPAVQAASGGEGPVGSRRERRARQAAARREARRA